MYEPMLDTFLAVADCGSFTKAAMHKKIQHSVLVRHF